MKLGVFSLLKGLNDEYFLNQESKTLFELLKKYSDIDYEAIVSKSNDSEWILLPAKKISVVESQYWLI